MQNFPDTKGQVTLQSVVRVLSKFELIFIVAIVTCKNKQDAIKNEGARLATRLYVNFSNAQGQIIQ